jgi:hypothetical protein
MFIRYGSAGLYAELVVEPYLVANIGLLFLRLRLNLRE